MIEIKEFEQICETVFSHSSSDETELVLGGGMENLTRFGENRITQNVSEERYELRIRVRVGQRSGVATTNDFSSESLNRVTDEAIQIARAQKDDPTLLSFHRGDRRVEDGAWHASCSELSADQRAGWVKTAVDHAKSRGMEIGGIALSRDGSIRDYGEIEPFAVANSSGLFRFGSLSESVLEVSATAGDGAGRARASFRDAGKIDALAIARDACDRAEASQNPETLPPGKYRVLFEAEAVRDLIFFFHYIGLNGLGVAEGRSPLAGKIGEQIVGENITLSEDPDHPDLWGLRFDGEGVDSRKMDLIRDGRLLSYLHDRKSASQLDSEPTGHGLPAPNSWGAFPRFPLLKGGKKNLDEMIAGVEDGVLVTRLWYTNIVDPMNMIITGMTRDGTFRIQEGKIGPAVKNFRFNQGLLDLFSQVE
ncbi:MAG: TldD/PmbA family protein, partial [Candidatus Krumholzibacteria bacterium]|nr:TldD/PmbA family protein [Candidatus Krumholzibacteria bacterium]